MVDSTGSLQDALRTATVEICATWDIDIPDEEGIELQRVNDHEYEALVPISGRVLLDTLLDAQGTLLGIRDGIAAELEGFQDNRLLLVLDYE